MGAEPQGLAECLARRGGSVCGAPAPELVAVAGAVRFDQVARDLSQVNGGMWHYRSAGLSWVNGSQRWYCCHEGALPTLFEARAVCGALGLVPGWSLGSCATALLRYVGPGDCAPWTPRPLRLGCPWAYLRCRPGTCDDATLYDVTAYYYSLARRLPCLRAYPGLDGCLRWGGWQKGEEGRWRAVIDAVGPAKGLRNALVGCAVGSPAGRPCYFRGALRRVKLPPGPFGTAFLLVVRSGAELTWRAARESEALWAHTDAVLCPRGNAPAAWGAAGLEVRAVARGEAEVCSLTVYRCGLKCTRWYKAGSRVQVPEPEPAVPLVWWHRQWL